MHIDEMKIMQRLQFYIIIKSPLLHLLLLLMMMMMTSCGVQLKTQNYFIAVLATSSGQQINQTSLNFMMDNFYNSDNQPLL